MMYFLRHNPRVTQAAALVALGGALAGVLLLAEGAAPSIDAHAKDAVAACASASDAAACYESEVPKLYPELSVSDIFGVIREVRRQDPRYQFCHVLAHKLGERVVAEDPEQWSSAIPLNPADGLCSNGFVHGVVGGRFRAEVLSDEMIERYIPDFTAACAPRPSYAPSDLDRAICYHGMGHLYDFITNADIPKALDICSRTTPADYSRMCIEGVFMQIYQPLEPDDFELIKQMNVKPEKDTVRDYCASYADPEYVSACLRESWPFFDEGIRDGSFAGTFCSWHQDAGRIEECYQTVSSLVGRMSLSDTGKAAAACGNFPAEWRWMCFGYSAEAVLQEARTESQHAVGLCLLADAPTQEKCFAHLLSHADFIFGSNNGQYRAFCEALPEQWSAECRRQQQAR